MSNGELSLLGHLLLACRGETGSVFHVGSGLMLACTNNSARLTEQNGDRYAHNTREKYA